jgi:hypothetical protein
MSMYARGTSYPSDFHTLLVASMVDALLVCPPSLSHKQNTSYHVSGETPSTSTITLYPGFSKISLEPESTSSGSGFEDTLGSIGSARGLAMQKIRPAVSEVTIGTILVADAKPPLIHASGGSCLPQSRQPDVRRVFGVAATAAQVESATGVSPTDSVVQKVVYTVPGSSAPIIGRECWMKSLSMYMCVIISGILVVFKKELFKELINLQFMPVRWSTPTVK